MPAVLRFIRRAGGRSFALLVALAVVVGGLASAARPASAASATVTATGRFAYVDDTGATIGIRNAFVELCDDDGATGCPTMSFGTTDANGFFTLTGTNGDFFNDLPDPMVKVTATGPSGFVQPTTLIDYCFASAPFNNAGNQSINFGTITPRFGRGCNITGGSTAGTDGAWQIWNNVREAWEFMRAQTMRNPGREVPPVRAIWPDPFTNLSFYRDGLPGLDSGAISVTTSDAFREPVIYHEYGEHVMRHFVETSGSDYNNGTCDTMNFLVFGGHCLWRSEKGSIAWTEGWPAFLAEVLSTTNSKNQTVSSLFGCDPIVPTLCGTIESPPKPTPDSNLKSVEGTVAAVLWDLFDFNQDNRDGNNSTDRLNLPFATLWDLYLAHDPDPFTARRNVLSLDELWDAFAAKRPTELNRVSEIYDENGISKPAADLTVTAADAGRSIVQPGDALTVTETTTNVGAVRTGMNSTTWMFLRAGLSGPLDRVIGRVVGDLTSAGGTANGSLPVTLPASLQPGDYYVVVCADGDGVIFESNEANNCRDSNKLTIPAPVAPVVPSLSISDASVTEGNSLSKQMNFTVSLSEPSSSPVSVNYATSDGTARAARDYDAKSGSVTFMPGQTSQTVPVTVRGDRLDENNPETFRVTLSSPSNATVSDDIGIGRIVDNDPRPNLRINNVSRTEGNSGTKDFTFRVTLSAVSGREVRVHWSTHNGSAIAGSDYIARHGTLVIRAGAPGRNIVIPVKGDHIHEPNQTFTVRLSNPTAANIADASGTGTIVNDD